ncbi:CBS domain-containing protein [Candidatus Micrarchaeota archaeon]|nr:CBS domain-containing protein [Candidatus Micrarchaeota archaeon]
MDQQVIETPVMIDGNETLSKAIGQLKQRNDDYFIVTDGTNKYAGVVDSRVLRDFYADPSKTKCQHLAVKPPVLRAEDSDEEVVRKLLATQTKVLPVLDKTDKVVGAVTRWKALALVKNASHLHGKKVIEIMSAPALSILDTASIAQARNAMKDGKIFRLVVINGKRQVVGMVSSFDLATRVQADPKDNRRQYYYFDTPKVRIDEEPVSSIMTSPAQTVSADKPVGDAVELMQKNGVSSFAVVSGGTLTGVLTVRDVFEACLVHERANVRFLGLNSEEHIFKTSLEDIGAKYWDKLSSRVDLQPDDELVVDIKAKNTGGARRQYEIKSRLTVKGKVFAAHPHDRKDHFKNWDLQAAVKESLDELVKIVMSEERT